MFPSGFVDIITDQKNECRLEWASLFDTEKLLGKQVMVIQNMDLLPIQLWHGVGVVQVSSVLSKVSWEALREALAVLERPSTVEEITDATWKVTKATNGKVIFQGLVTDEPGQHNLRSFSQRIWPKINFLTYAAKVPCLTFCDKMRQFSIEEMDREGGIKEKMRKCREWISLHFLLLSSFSHSLSTFSQPGCRNLYNPVMS